jgi:hypothetical protein
VQLSVNSELNGSSKKSPEPISFGLSHPSPHIANLLTGMMRVMVTGMTMMMVMTMARKSRQGHREHHDEK